MCWTPLCTNTKNAANVYLKEKKKEEMWKQNISNILNKFDTRTNYFESAHELLLFSP
jgi:hypothetical protein